MVRIFFAFFSCSGKTSELLQKAQQVEQFMKMICQDDDDDSSVIDNEDARYQYTVPSTGATVTGNFLEILL